MCIGEHVITIMTEVGCMKTKTSFFCRLNENEENNMKYKEKPSSHLRLPFPFPCHYSYLRVN